MRSFNVSDIPVNVVSNPRRIEVKNKSGLGRRPRGQRRGIYCANSWGLECWARVSARGHDYWKAATLIVVAIIRYGTDVLAWGSFFLVSSSVRVLILYFILFTCNICFFFFSSIQYLRCIAFKRKEKLSDIFHLFLQPGPQFGRLLCVICSRGGFSLTRPWNEVLQQI